MANKSPDHKSPDHTPGFLAVRPDGFGGLEVSAENTGITVAIIIDAFGVGKANARRMAACWNACQDLPAVALEQGALTELLRAVPALIETLPPSNDTFVQRRRARVLTALALLGCPSEAGQGTEKGGIFDAHA